MKEILCDGCGKQRMSLKTIASKILAQMIFNLCGDCEQKGIEPRWLIILAARDGRDVSHWIENRLYYGHSVEEHLN